MIVHDEQNGLFTLHTKNSTYQMKVDKYNILLHTYYGPRLGDADLSRLIRYADRGFSPNPGEAGHCRTYSLDTLPQEYSTSGAGDFRLPSLELELPDGSHVTELRYTGFRRVEGKYVIEGLPAFFGDGGETLVLLLEDAAAKVAVELCYGVFEDYDLITRAARIINLGPETIEICRAASLCLDFPAADMDYISFNGRHAMERCMDRSPLRPGVQSVGSVRGTSSHQHNPFVMLCSRDAGEEHGLCYGAMLLYSGNFEAGVERSQFETCRLVMGINPYHFRYSIRPGKGFTTPEAALVFSNCGFGNMSRQFHRAIMEHLRRDNRPGRKPVLVNSWEAAYFDFDSEKLLELAGQAAELGIELFVLDDGWFGRRNSDLGGLGDWWVNLEKLPGGLEALVPKINALGMEFGLWIEPEMVSEDSELYRQHPDWVLCAPGREPVRGRSQLVLDFTREEVRDHIYREISRVLSSANISYLKWDMNRSLTQVWSAGLPPQRQGEVYHRYVLGVYELLERFRRDYPGILIEGCSGGGGRFDAGMLYYTPQIWCSDNTDAIDRLSIQYGTSFAYPPCTMGAHVSAVPNEINRRSTPLETRGTVAMAGVFGYEMDLCKTSPEEREIIARQICRYKEWWDLVEQGDYYRLSAPGEAFTAWAHISRDKRRALVSLVTGPTHAAPPFMNLRISGLEPGLNYRINGAESFPGDLLMYAGYPLPLLLGDYQSMQLYLEAE